MNHPQLDYYINESGALKSGPFNAFEVKEKFNSGKISFASLVWTKGLSEWKRLDDPFWQDLELQISESSLDTKRPQEDTGNTDYTLKNQLDEKKLYFRKLELGWWEMLLEDIQEQDIVEELADISFLNEQQERIRRLEKSLQRKGILKGSPKDFITQEYHDFDNSAEELEQIINSIILKVKSNDFLNDFFDSKDRNYKDNFFSPIIDEVHKLCKDFRKANEHRIMGSENLDIWKLFGEKYGESEDLPLLYDIIIVANNDHAHFDLLKGLYSPSFNRLNEIIECLVLLRDEDGKLVKDNYILLKKLLGLTSSSFILNLISHKEKMFEHIKLRLDKALFSEHPTANREIGMVHDLPAIDMLNADLLKIDSETVRLNELSKNWLSEDTFLNAEFNKRIQKSYATCKSLSKEISKKITQVEKQIRIKAKKRRDRIIYWCVFLYLIIHFPIVDHFLYIPTRISDIERSFEQAKKNHMSDGTWKKKGGLVGYYGEQVTPEEYYTSQRYHDLYYLSISGNLVFIQALLSLFLLFIWTISYFFFKKRIFGYLTIFVLTVTITYFRWLV